MKIAVIHGANLNFTGIRQPEVYGNTTFEQICEHIEKAASRIATASGSVLGLNQFQSNSEGEIIDFIQMCHIEGFDGIVLNAGAYTHYSYAIADAVAGCNLPVIEVHLSNIFAREDFRQKSVIAPYCIGTISGFGVDSYLLAINHLIYLGGTK
ncbi:MAG: 3-dehydroquinate dehydratase [Defluviitaleaceae bacterium]|nr:3-dehydroquinate dehydratase [Defluviitaleaceae bacterium]